MQVVVSSEVTGVESDACWALYHDAFSTAEVLAVERHLMRRSEFDEVMADPRWGKYRAVDHEGALAGLATITTAFEAMPLIAPEYFDARWPELYAQRRIFFVGFAATHPNRRWTSALASITRLVGSQVADVDGLLVLDMNRNRAQRRLPEFVLTQFRHVAGDDVQLATLDEQVYYAYEFSPTPEDSSTPRTISLADDPAVVVGSAAVRSTSAGSTGLP